MDNQLAKNPIFNMDFLNRNDDVIIASLGAEKAEVFKQNCMMYLSSTSDNLITCEPNSILTAMLMATNLGLPVNKSLGLCWVIPYSKSKKINENDWIKEHLAQFQIGYKGYVSLAMQAGYSMALAEIIYEEHITDNTFDEVGTYKFNRKNQLEIQRKPIAERNIVGYYAVAKYRNFKAELFWTKDEMEAHAYKYSDGYRFNKDNKKTGSTWQNETEKMALKTMLRQVLGKNMVPNKRLIKAYEADMSAIELDGSYNYLDSQDKPTPKPVLKDPRDGKKQVLYDNFMKYVLSSDIQAKTTEDLAKEMEQTQEKRYCDENEATLVLNALIENKDAGIIAEEKAIVLENYIKAITIKEN
jgi:recombination protein RecT